MKTLNIFRTTLLAGSLLLQLKTFCFLSRGAAGDVDLSFDPGSGVNGQVNAVAVQPDGKVIIGGDFTTVKGLVRTNLARLNADGSGDVSFDPGASFYSVGFYRPVRAIVLQPDGKLVIGHDYGIGRFNSDGSPDTNFTGAIQFTSVLSIALYADGKMLVGGYFSIANGTNNNTGIARLNSDGSLDATFVARAFVYPEYCEECPEFYPAVNSVAIQSDGKVLAGGDFDNLNGTNRNRLVRFNVDGSLDGSFNPGFETPNRPVGSIAAQSDGKVLIAGDFTSINGTNRNRIARLHANGSLDSSFNPGSRINDVVRSVVMQTDGKVLIGGAFSMVNGTNRNGIARLNANGSLDSSFNPGTGANGEVRAIALQPQGQVFIGGLFNSVNSTNRNRVARLNADGSVDNGFHPGKGLGSPVSSLVLQPDGKVLIGGLFTFLNGTNQYGSARLNADGSLDGTFISSSFNPDLSNGIATAIAVQLDGKVLVAGYTREYVQVLDTWDWVYSYFVNRFNADASRDNSFNSSLDTGYGDYSSVRSIALQPDGKVIIGGGFHSVNGTNRNGIARLDANGSLDASFNPGTGIGHWSVSVSSVVVQLDGKVLIGGWFSEIDGVSRNGIARLNANGSLDHSFNPGTGVYSVSSLALQADGKVLFGGYITLFSGGSARLNADGSLDSTFNPGTGAEYVRSIALQSDGNVLIGGTFITVNGVLRPYVARLYGNSVAPSLSIARSNAFVIVSWPVTALNFQLQESANLSLPNSWSSVAQPAVTNAGQVSVTVPTTVGRKFFRLESQ